MCGDQQRRSGEVSAAGLWIRVQQTIERLPPLQEQVSVSEDQPEDDGRSSNETLGDSIPMEQAQPGSLPSSSEESPVLPSLPLDLPVR